MFICRAPIVSVGELATMVSVPLTQPALAPKAYSILLVSGFEAS